MHVLAHGETTGGLAGITASVLGAAGEFEVDYILILADGLPEIVVDPEACRPVSTELSPIGIRLEQNELVLTWSGAAVLEESAQAEGPYSPVAGNPSSPYRAPVNGTRKFFRLKEAP